jgi:hypothetical protein
LLLAVQALVRGLRVRARALVMVMVMVMVGVMVMVLHAQVSPQMLQRQAHG